MRSRIILFSYYLFILGLLVLPTAISAQSSIPAFPGAEGFGADTPGGRGGKVLEVTNLNDSGPGSLRAALEASGARIVVFRVGGIIDLQSYIRIDDPYLTIAGQTAPGDGITIKKSAGERGPLWIGDGAHDIIIRYLTIRPGGNADDEGTNDALTITDGSYNIIIDHCSLSWATDEVFNTWGSSHNITVQWSIISEGLDCSTHPEGCHSKGSISGSGEGSGRITFHHNLFAHNKDRNPMLSTDEPVDLVNNVIYNPGVVMNFYDQYGYQVKANVIKNYYKAGPSGGDNYLVRCYEADGGPGHAVYVEGNISPHRPSDSDPEENCVYPDSRAKIVSTRFDAPAVTTVSAQEAYEQVLAEAGNSQGVDSEGNWYWRRDPVDERVVSDVRNGTGKRIDDPAEVGGWPHIASGTPYSDTDHDGMADDWELSYFSKLSRSSSSDSSSDYDGDGYTDLGEFLKGTDPTDGKPVRTPASAVFIPFVRTRP